MWRNYENLLEYKIWLGVWGTKSPRSKNFLVIKVPIQAVFVSFIIQKIYQWFV